MTSSVKSRICQFTLGAIRKHPLSVRLILKRKITVVNHFDCPCPRPAMYCTSSLKDGGKFLSLSPTECCASRGRTYVRIPFLLASGRSRFGCFLFLFLKIFKCRVLLPSLNHGLYRYVSHLILLTNIFHTAIIVK